jgi:hypothetical protein
VKEHEVQSALYVLDKLTAACGDLFFAAPEQGGIEPLERIGVVDALATMPTKMFLAYVGAIDANRRKSILTTANKINWKSRRGIYLSGLPRYLLARLEWLQPRIQFEIESEGQQVSPDWYIGELILQQVTESTKKAVNIFFLKIEAIYETWLNAAAKSNLLWIGAGILARESEYWSKMKFHRERLSDYWADLSCDKRIEGLLWPIVDFDQLDQSRITRERQVIQLMTTHSTALSLVTRPDTYPDFAGQFLHTAGEALFTAMFEGDTATVNALFPNFFQSSLLQFNRILARASELDWRVDVAVKVAVAPVLDLMDLSGYAILFSELYSDESISDLILREWSNYLDAADPAAPASRASFLATAISLTDSAFELAHRSSIRMSWRQKVSQRLRQLERRPASRRGRGVFWDETVVMHDSPVIRVYADNEAIMYDGIDLFIEVCLRTRDDGKELKFGRRHGRLGDAMAREEASSSYEELANDE